MNSTSEVNPIQPTSSNSHFSIGQPELLSELTLLSVIRELRNIQAEMNRGSAFLYDAECKLADKELEYERALQGAFLNATGTAADKTAISRLQASEARLGADLAKAELNRVRTKLKHLELTQMNLQTQARLLETELKALK